MIEKTNSNNDSDGNVAVQSNNNLVQAMAKSKYSTVYKVSTAILMGLGFGTLFARSRVFEPELIKGQFVFENFLMLKMFLSASGSSAAVFWLMGKTGKKDIFEKAREKKEKAFGRRRYSGIFFGSALSGMGMAIGGACPGMVLSQVGTGVSNSIYTYVGGFAGALLYGLFDPLIKPLLIRSDEEEPMKKVFFDQHFNISASTLLAAFSVFAIGCSAALEIIFPWRNDLSVPNDPSCNMFTCRAIPPSVAGVLLGLLQYPALYILSTFLGASTSYVCVSGACTTVVGGSETFKYLAKYGKIDISTWWQVLYVNFAILGSFIAEITAGGLVHPKGLTLAEALLGGFLMVFGARIAHGCTTGHGLSGMPALMKHSIVAVVGMFAAGIATGFTRQALNI